MLNKPQVAIVIAFLDFQDEEYFITREVLEKAGCQITIISSQTGEALGVFGGTVAVDLTAQTAKASDYNALVFVGGGGMAKNLDSKPFQQLAQEGAKQDKLLAAICIAPALLAKAGVLRNKKATVWTSAMDKKPAAILTENSCLYQAQHLVVDDNIITADGPDQARQFGEAIISKLKM